MIIITDATSGKQLNLKVKHPPFVPVPSMYRHLVHTLGILSSDSNLR